MSDRVIPSPAQVRTTAAVVRWYLERYYGTADDPGVAARFCEREQVGAFAIDREELAAGKGAALFRLLVVTAMFQRRQDAQILRILRSIKRSDALELTSARRLLSLVDQAPCRLLRSNDALINECDLTKDPRTKLGCCEANPRARCHLKKHTVLLKRYGHFGKVPTSAALLLREAGARDLSALRDAIFREVRGGAERAQRLEEALTKAWRIHQKIACMFLSAVTNPDLSPGLSPWAHGIDWTRFVIIDSNVDLFLGSIGYRGGRSYDARRAFVRAIAERIDLREMDRRLHASNPRVVQQAIYLFMSIANRRGASVDCSRLGPKACAACPSALARRCALRK